MHPRPTVPLPRSTDLLLTGGYIVAYILIDWISYVQPLLQLGITPWSPQAGLTLTYLICFGHRRAIVTLLAAFLAEIIVRDVPAPLPLLLLASAAIAAGYALIAWLLPRGHSQVVMESPRSVVWLLMVSGAVTLAVAVLYVGVFRVAQILPPFETFRGVRRYWLGDLNGILTLTPVLLAAVRYRDSGARFWMRRWELLAQIASVLLVMWVAFGTGTYENLRLFYLLFVPVIWIAFRWGPSGAALCTLAVQLGLVVAAGEEADNPPIVDLQLLMTTLEATALLLGAVVMQHAAALEQVAAREAEQRAILRTAPDGVLALDAVTRITSANPAALQLFGLSEAELLGQSVEERLPGTRLELVQGRASVSGMRGNGVPFPADVAWARLEPPALAGVILIVRDATERLNQESRIRERDTELARATRFAMLGELASALTHELNQPMTALVSYVRAAQILAAPFDAQDARLADTLNKAAREAIRTAEILRKLRDFYRGGAPKLAALGLEQMVQATLGSCEDRFRQAGVQVDRDFEAGIPALQCDQTQLEMILHNILGNALEAVTQQGTTRRIRLSAIRRNSEVLLSIEDSGPGLAADVEARLFQPFVTTKVDGMGLGLAISRSLLRNQGGDIWIERGTLGGARFVMSMPIAADSEAAR